MSSNIAARVLLDQTLREIEEKRNQEAEKEEEIPHSTDCMTVMQAPKGNLVVTRK
ncbi:MULTISPECIES: hypothetical protein [Lactobacillus]|uniref:hypothetical protein n=1 Tax=Lactobacillus TaxID=1578 RepID=UPI0013748275|nr:MULTISPECIES: hypothetical protein [Lactobacillus]